MVGVRVDWVVKKPGRSDEVIPPEEQLRKANETRSHFDSIAPKRPHKPNRSEISSPDDSPLTHTITGDPPELQKLQELRSRYLPVFADGRVDSVEEFVETDYYSSLNSIDKLHHTTGTGFIRAVQGGAETYLKLEEGGIGFANGVVVKSRTNPATNDWIPEEDSEMVFASSKPNRSESNL